MAATHHLNAEQTGHIQLPMFMRATDLRESITGTIDRSFEDPDEVMESKLTASKRTTGGHGSGVHKSIKERGVINPVQLVHAEHGNLMMGQGGHRAAAADDIMRTTGKDVWVPVVHTDAREGSANPVNTYSEPEAKREAIADYRRWSQDTPAFGQDIHWLEGRGAKPPKRRR